MYKDFVFLTTSLRPHPPPGQWTIAMR